MGLVRPVDLVPLDQLGGVHFIAIGGAGMSGIAMAFAQSGVAVSGSDQAHSAALRQLADAGVRVHVGHDADHLGDAQTVVVSSAVKESNVELAEARRRGLRVWHRSAALGALMLGRAGVAVTGTHGKTTTTGMVATMLIEAGVDPGYVIGSPLAATGRSAALGSGDAFVVEADESDGSFLQYPAPIVVITNVEADHLDNWGTPEAYHEGFVTMGTRDGVEVVIISADDAGSIEIAEALRGRGTRVVTVGESPDADVCLTDLAFTPELTSATLTAADDAGLLELIVPGRFNLHNAAAAYAVGREVGLDGAVARAALRAFAGTHRRFEAKGAVNGVRVFDDYAHHPTEVAAILTAARGRAGDGRLVACFQPRLFSRTRDFAAEFGDSLALADEIVVLGVYPAREAQVDYPDVTGRLVADAAAAASGRAVTYVEDVTDAPAALASLVRPGDLVLTIGAGDVTTVGPALVGALGGGSAG